jgi:bifunctional non-homologous end joining protein LigD
MYHWIKPMAATLTERRFTDAGWLFERKYDGIRLVAFKQGPEVRLLSRNQLPQHLPVISAGVAALPAEELILDGEMTWGAGLAFHVFDVMWIDGRDVMPLSLDARRAILRGLPLSPPLHLVPELIDPEPWTRACAEGWEGVIAKRRDSRYEQRRSPHWLKMKCELTAEFVVGGFTDPQGSRSGFGALLLGRHVDGDFVFVGKVGTGFDTRMLADLRARLDALRIEHSPFTRAKGLPRLRAHWVAPAITVQVAFIEWTVHGKLRHSRLIAVTS